MLRPALWVTREHLVMRNLAETVHIRLAAVEEMAVRQVLAVRAADRPRLPLGQQTQDGVLQPRHGGPAAAALVLVLPPRAYRVQHRSQIPRTRVARQPGHGVVDGAQRSRPALPGHG